MTATEVRLTPQEMVDAARAERDAGMEQAETADRDGWDRYVIDQAIRAYASTGVPFSANDMRELLPEVRSALIGSRFMTASKRGEIRRCGLVVSTKKNTHGKDVARWVGARKDQA